IRRHAVANPAGQPVGAANPAWATPAGSSSGTGPARIGAVAGRPLAGTAPGTPPASPDARRLAAGKCARAWVYRASARARRIPRRAHNSGHTVPAAGRTVIATETARYRVLRRRAAAAAQPAMAVAATLPHRRKCAPAESAGIRAAAPAAGFPAGAAVPGFHRQTG